MCVQCIGFFSSAKFLARQKERCNCPYYMAVVYYLLNEGTKWDNLRYTDFKTTTYASFVIYADFESVLKPINDKVNNTHYLQRHEVCAGTALLTFNRSDGLNKMEIHVRKNALSNFLKVFISERTRFLSI